MKTEFKTIKQLEKEIEELESHKKGNLNPNWMYVKDGAEKLKKAKTQLQTSKAILKSIDEMDTEFDKKENYSLKGEKKLCCQVTLRYLKQRIEGKSEEYNVDFCGDGK